jgi:DNA-binding PadR family transcriptional regulator
MKQPSNYIGEFEELVLLAILKLGADAYGAAIHEALEDAGRRMAIGALYTTLSRLEEKGFVTSRLGEATAERGGRAKKYFKVQAAGMRVLREAENARRKLSPDFGIAFTGGAA